MCNHAKASMIMLDPGMTVRLVKLMLTSELDRQSHIFLIFLLLWGGHAAHNEEK